jgi:hypothetical protein
MSNPRSASRLRKRVEGAADGVEVTEPGDIEEYPV